MPISVCVPVEKQDMIFDSLHLLWEDRIGLDATEFKSRSMDAINNQLKESNLDGDRESTWGGEVMPVRDVLFNKWAFHKGVQGNFGYENHWINDYI